MSSVYEIRILCDEKEKLQIEAILGQSSDDSKLGWSLTIGEDSPSFIGALSHFSNLISTNISSLNKIGIIVENISFWFLYEYEGQCNMEFEPNIMKELGDLGIVLCISCWEK